MKLNKSNLLNSQEYKQQRLFTRTTTMQELELKVPYAVAIQLVRVDEGFLFITNPVWLVKNDIPKSLLLKREFFPVHCCRCAAQDWRLRKVKIQHNLLVSLNFLFVFCFLCSVPWDNICCDLVLYK